MPQAASSTYLEAAAAAHFTSFGFAVLRGGLPARTTAAVLAEAERLLATAAGAPELFEPTVGRSLVDPVERSPELTRLLLEDSDSPLLPLLRPLLGGPALWCGSELTEEPEAAAGRGDEATAAQAPGAQCWHSDRPGTLECAFPRLKVMLYLTPTRAGEGALSIIPASHREPLHGLM